jgi:AcrR family transcriptional regulator
MAIAPRKIPAQQRSRERMDRILAIASELIGQHGSDQLKMSDVAARAEISIGSLYQYFPDKASIIRRLAERYSEESRRCVQEALEGITSASQLEAAYLGLLDQHYALFLAEPVMRDIWSGMQADKELMGLELQESRVCSEMLADAMHRVFKSADPQQLSATAFLVWQLGEAAMRLAISVGRKEGDAMIEAFKHMTVREIMQP